VTAKRWWPATLLPGAIALAAWAGPVEVYRTGPELCPHDRPASAPALTEAQAVERARALVPRDFCGPSTFVSGCDALPEWAVGAWRVWVHQYKQVGTHKDYGGLTHTYIILDRVGNCLAHMAGTELGGRD
jgi:hypothetical protein